ncbi:MAG: 3-oxoacyl-[acyl-carrier protein] reductase [Acetobacteraceae bacterium]|nr:family NAD(P)-dependent oxidoreductase [Rhodopila sp.]MEA2726980.1 3-oxoacyl-[acyl-carrier protein] reductase [Acetobacteraceae bacterium]
MNRLEGKHCVVTGGARGIGRAIALAFAREGADVVILDRNEELAAKTADEARNMGVRSAAFAADVSDEQSATAALQRAEEAIGSVDVLVNNAGISDSALLVDLSVEAWDRMIAVNLRSVFLCTRVVLPGMIGRRWGRIISTSSQLAHKGGVELVHYAAAKAGILGFTRSLAYEVAQFGITVNAICPGPIETDMSATLSEAWRARKRAEVPLGRFGHVEEIAPTAVLLASDEGSYYTGASLNPNGGDVMI